MLIVTIGLIITIIILFNFLVQRLKTKCIKMRYLEFGENDRRWVTMDEYDQLLKKGKCIYPGFVDITDLVNPDVTYYQEARERSIAYRMLRAVPKALTQQTLVLDLIKSINTKRMYTLIKKLSEYPNRYAYSDTGAQSADFLFDYISKIVQSSQNPRAQVAQIKSVTNDYNQKSIIACIKGSIIPDEIIIYCAHLDSINSKDPKNGIAPGADDNATGIANVIEILSILLSPNISLKRTTEFHLYAAEELGLKGSTEIAEQYKTQGKNVVAVFNNDMTGYTIDGKTAYILNGITDIVDAELVDLCKQLAPVYTNLVIVDGGCGYSCTDNFSWARYGYPTCAVSEASPQKGKLNPYIHSAKDTIENVNIDYSAEHAKLALSFVVETANM